MFIIRIGLNLVSEYQWDIKWDKFYYDFHFLWHLGTYKIGTKYLFEVNIPTTIKWKCRWFWLSLGSMVNLDFLFKPYIIYRIQSFQYSCTFFDIYDFMKVQGEWLMRPRKISIHSAYIKGSAYVFCMILSYNTTK